MTCIIAGSRWIDDYKIVEDAFTSCPLRSRITEIVSGTAKGVDTLGERVAVNHHLKVMRFPANWKRYGKRAGKLRNGDMGDYADMAIIVWDGESRGTKHMIEYMREIDKPVHLVIHRKEDHYGNEDVH